MSPFTILGAKIFAGVSLALLILAAILYWQLGNAKAEVEKQRNLVAECNAARAVQNAAIRAQAEEGQRQRQAFSEALKSGQDAILAAQGRVTIVRQTARSACNTPPQVMGAGL